MSLNVGDTLPPFPLLHLDGTPFQPSDRLTLWCVYKTDCPTCDLALPYWSRMAQAYPGLRVVGLAQDPPEDAAAFADGRAQGLELAWEEDPYPASAALQVLYTPTLYLTADGVVVDVVEAFSRSRYNEVAETIARRLGCPPVPAVPEDDPAPQFQFG